MKEIYYFDRDPRNSIVGGAGRTSHIGLTLPNIATLPVGVYEKGDHIIVLYKKEHMEYLKRRLRSVIK